MSRSIRIPATAAAVASALSVGSIVRADDASQSQPPASALQEIVVTADKREEKLSDVPMSVTALQGSALNNLQFRDFSDFAPLVPGLSLASDQPGLIAREGESRHQRRKVAERS